MSDSSDEKSDAASVESAVPLAVPEGDAQNTGEIPITTAVPEADAPNTGENSGGIPVAVVASSSGEGHAVMGVEAPQESEAATSDEVVVIPYCKGKWYDDEVAKLTSAYLNASEDPLAGIDQKKTVFWKSVALTYADLVKNPRRERSLTALQSKWGETNREVKYFAGILGLIIRNNESGASPEQLFTRALEQYKQDKNGKDFMFRQSWEIMKDHPKWEVNRGDQPGETKKRELRPVDGRKAAKKKRSQEDEQAGFQRQFLAQLEARTQSDNMKLLFAMYSESSCPVNERESGLKALRAKVFGLVSAPTPVMSPPHPPLSPAASGSMSTSSSPTSAEANADL
jgi:hypothetical protein